MTLPIVRAGTLPEDARYPDEGCDLAPVCLDCPLVLCKHDDPNASRRIRNRKIVRAHQNGTSVVKISSRLGVPLRVVFRILANPQHGLARNLVDTDVVTTLAQLAKKSVIHAHRPWTEMVRYD